MPWGSWKELPTEFEWLACKRELSVLGTAVFAARVVGEVAAT
jgi:hypothetical protein